MAKLLYTHIHAHLHTLDNEHAVEVDNANQTTTLTFKNFSGLVTVTGHVKVGGSCTWDANL